MFDPIRGSTIEKPPPSPTPFMPNRASASPSIKSLIDPHPPTSQPTRVTSASGASVPKPSPSRNPIPTTSTSAPSKPAEDEKPARKLDSGPPSTNPTPPPAKRSKEPPPPPPPLPKGSGLLSGTPFGISAAGANGANGTNGVERGTNIWLSFALKGKENVTINFSHEVETKYGLSALNPRLAARKERQRQLALAGAELERQAHGGTGSAAGDGDDMSLDLSEPEGGSDTDVVMKDAADKEQPATKKRKRKAEDYDRNDDFIDDAELLLEEQALMSKDGFFVYSGPLIDEGEKPAVERYVSSLGVFRTAYSQLLQGRRHDQARSGPRPRSRVAWRSRGRRGGQRGRRCGLGHRGRGQRRRRRPWAGRARARRGDGAEAARDQGGARAHGAGEAEPREDGGFAGDETGAVCVGHDMILQPSLAFTLRGYWRNGVGIWVATGATGL
jgi:hypothetical protein